MEPSFQKVKLNLKPTGYWTGLGVLRSLKKITFWKKTIKFGFRNLKVNRGDFFTNLKPSRSNLWGFQKPQRFQYVFLDEHKSFEVKKRPQRIIENLRGLKKTSKVRYTSLHWHGVLGRRCSCSCRNRETHRHRQFLEAARHASSGWLLSSLAQFFRPTPPSSLFL